MYSYISTFLNRSWAFWLSIGLIILFILWLFYGGKDHEYVGLGPLKTGVDSTLYVNGDKYEPYQDIPDITLASYDEDQYSEESCYGDYTEESDSYDNAVDHVKSNSNDSQYYDFSPNSRIHFSGESYKKHDLSNIATPVPEDNQSVKIDNRTDYKRLLSSYDRTMASRERRGREEALGYGKFKMFNVKKRSKGEQKCKEAIEEIYGKPFYTIRPDFLKNPETKRNLEIDLYNDSIRVGVEYNGASHYYWPNYTGQSKEDFIKQVRKDKFKVDMCDKHGIYLISVPYNVPLDKIKEYITYYLPENVRKRESEQELDQEMINN